jgi:hypothetical protein
MAGHAGTAGRLESVMKQTIALMLALVGCTALVSLAAREQSAGTPAQDFLASHYSSGPARATISTAAGQVLSVLDVPAGIALSVHLIKGQVTPVNEKTVTVTFSGDVSIRTRPRSELVDGSSREQMMKAPLRLDVQDAVVVVTPER